MRNHHYPIAVYKQKSFGDWIVSFPQVPPLSFLLSLFFLLSCCTVAAGYFTKPPNSKANGLSEIKLALLPSHIQETIALSENNTEISGKQYFAFDAGVVILDKNFKDQQKIASNIGLPFHMDLTNKRVTMTRLYLGTFPFKKGMKLYGKIQKKFPGAFVMHNRQDQTVDVFCGSFYFPGAARKEKERISKAGYTVKEIPSRVSIPLYAAYIGDFDSTADAEIFRQKSSENSVKEMNLVAIR